MPRVVRAAAATVLAVVVAALALGGCQAVASPSAPDAGWYDAALGGPADIAVVIHVADVLRDPYYGPIVQQSVTSRDRGADSLSRLFLGCDEIAVVASVGRGSRHDGDSLLVVLYDPPAGLDVAHVVDRDGQPYFAPGHPLAGGVVEHRGADDGDMTLWEVPGAWVAAKGAAVAHTRDSLASTGAPPPRFDPEPDTLLSALIRRDALGARGLRDLKRSSGGLLDGFEEGVVAVGHGPAGELVLRVRMSSDESARAIEAELQASMTPDARCDSACLLVHALLLQLVDVKRDGNEVSVRVHIPEPVMRALAERARSLRPRSRHMEEMF